jgi:hypothetical protein|tara:strand:+ start:749 stop:1192 length:444 start_codon:yes stop_codon:yes gene_type:complete
MDLLDKIDRQYGTLSSGEVKERVESGEYNAHEGHGNTVAVTESVTGKLIAGSPAFARSKEDLDAGKDFDLKKARDIARQRLQRPDGSWMDGTEYTMHKLFEGMDKADPRHLQLFMNYFWGKPSEIKQLTTDKDLVEELIRVTRVRNV